jgi:hypothetical protein
VGAGGKTAANPCGGIATDADPGHTFEDCPANIQALAAAEVSAMAIASKFFRIFIPLTITRAPNRLTAGVPATDAGVPTSLTFRADLAAYLGRLRDSW